MAARKSPSVWESIQREYLAGEDSIREIADRHEVSEAAIRKRAKADKWQRAVRTPRPARTLVMMPEPAPAAPAEPIPVAEIAEHARQLVGRMLDELDTVTSHQGELEAAIEIEFGGDEDGRRRDVMLKAVSLPARSMIAKNLATALKTINEASAPQGKKAATQQRANEVGRRFGAIGAPTMKTVN